MQLFVVHEIVEVSSADWTVSIIKYFGSISNIPEEFSTRTFARLVAYLGNDSVNCTSTTHNSVTGKF